ncbi:MAG: BamA/TamA family outer membrane protein [Verrucomicrobiota bacterium]|jgi:outer membrane protein insertion porin family
MSFLLRLCGFVLLFACLPAGWAQFAPLKVSRIDLKHIGPPAVSDDLIRSNLRVKVGDPYLRAAVDDDVRNLYATGFFYNIQVVADDTADGVILTYKVQGKPRLTEIKFQGNTKYKDTKLLKKISSKTGEPLDERKLFTDTQEIEKLYQKSGYPHTRAKYVLNIDENAGRGTATFQITESSKVKIIEVDFVGAKAVSVRKLRKAIKTRKHWMFSWITGSGVFKEEQFDEDKEKLAEFYRDKGYIDFEIKDVQFLNPTPRTMIIRFTLYEGTQYKVGSVKFTGNKLFTTQDIAAGLRAQHERSRSKAKIGPNGLPMDVGDTFKPGGLTKDSKEVGLAQDIEAVEDFYGAKGYIDVHAASHNLNVVKIPNTETGTMDLEFQIEEGQKSYIEKIEVRGNTKTKDKVIRRELAVSPGELFDMVRVKLSKQRLEGLGYFERVDTRPEATDVPNRKNLVVDVDEKTTGHVSLGAGFSTVDSLVGIAEYNESNFNLSDPFQPPWFRGGGQKFRLRVTIGSERQDYELTFIEPWFLDRKLQLSVDLYYHDYEFLSPNYLYDEIRAGGKVGLERALGSDFLRGGVSYTLEDVGIDLTSSAILPSTTTPIPPYIQSVPTLPNSGAGPGRAPGGSTLVENPGSGPVYNPGNVPPVIQNETGNSLLSRFGASLAYDTRNSVRLPDKGQRTELDAEIVTLDWQFYKLELKTGWYFKGLAKGHVLELAARTGVAQSLQAGEDVPFFEHYYLGGLYSLRGFKYRYVSPREPGYNEPIGGDTYWFGSAEYSIPIFEQEGGIGVRFAFFYDIGSVGSSPYNFNPDQFSDNWGLGLRLNLPIGPLRLDYGIPIHHDQYSGSGGQFQFGVGWTRQF